MSDAFRAANSPSADPLGDAPTATTSGTDLKIARQSAEGSLFTHEALNGSPYTVKHFNLANFWDSPTADMRDDIKEVDSWVQEQAKARGLADKTDSYQEIIDGILDQIGKSPNEKPDRTFERVQKAIQAHKRLAEAKLPPILNVQSLSPDEYKETRA